MMPVRHIVLTLGVLSFVSGASAQTVRQSFTGTVYISSGGPGLFATPPGASVSGTFTIGVGSLGAPLLSSATFNEWAQKDTTGILGDIPANNSDSISATSSYGSFTASNLQSVILSTAYYDIEYGGGPGALGPGGGFAISSYQGDSPLPITLATAFPISLPAGDTGLFGLNDNLNQYFIEINLTSLGPSQQVGPVTILDPVPDLLDGAHITADRPTLASGGRAVKGITADGIAQVIFHVPVQQAGDVVTATLFSNCADPLTPSTCSVSTNSDEDGGLFSVGGRVSASISLPSIATDTAQGNPDAFIAYRAPLDFVRPSTGTDSQLASRKVYIQFSYASGNSSVYYYVSSPMSLSIIRPPVILLHGYSTNAKKTWGYYPLIADKRFQTQWVDYGSITVDVRSPYPTLPSALLDVLQPCNIDLSDCSYLVHGSDLGFTYNTPIVSDGISQALAEVRQGNNPVSVPVAAVQADIVAHSMGGLIARYWATGLSSFAFRTNNNYQQGYIHKLITLGAPNYGSPLAIVSLAPSSYTSRTLAALGGTISISSAMLSNGVPVNGAAGELSGDGVGRNMNAELQALQAAGATLTTVNVAGSITPEQTTLMALIHQLCPATDSLAARYPPELYDTLFDPYISLNSPTGEGRSIPNDGAVPLSSALKQDYASCLVGDGNECFGGISHGKGTAIIVGVPTTLVDPLGIAETEVENLLNTSITDHSIWALK